MQTVENSRQEICQKQTVDLKSKIVPASKIIASKIDEVLDLLGITKVKRFHNRISFCCPIHNGDNSDACVLYIDPDCLVPNWKCYTHNCHETHGKSLLMFVKSCLGISLEETLIWIREQFNIDDINTDDRVEQLSSYRIISKNKKESANPVEKTVILNTLRSPVDFYLTKGFKKETLEKYDVGICVNGKSPMFNRIVVPIYDDEHNMIVGTIGRTLYKKCILCDQYHDFKKPCPDKKYHNFSKWKNSPNFYCNSYLYNYWFAKESIQKTNTAYIVEGSPDVWRMYEAGIYNTLGIFGNTISEDQRIILEKTGATNLILFLDPDEGGEIGRKSIKKYLSRFYNIFDIFYKKEPADCDIEELYNVCHSI